MSVKTELNYPGTISLGDPQQSYPGCKAKWFYTIWGYNWFFREVPGKAGHALLAVRVEPMTYFFGLLTGVLVHYTKQLSPEEEQDFIEVSREIEFAMNDRRKARREAQEKENLVKALTDQEMKRLAEVGKKYEDRVSHAKAKPTLKEQNDAMATLNSGDPEVLFYDKMDAFKAGYVKGYESGKGGDK